MDFTTNVIVSLVSALIGGVLAIWMAFYGVIGRFLFDRLLTKIRADLDRDLKRLQGEIDRTIIVHRAHFETEFAALRNIWQKVAKLRAVFPLMEHPGPDPENQATGRKAVADATADLIQAIDSQSPFYAKDIYADLDELRVMAKTALSAHEGEHAGRRIVGRDYGDDVRQLTDRISDRIRNRIASLTVVG